MDQQDYDVVRAKAERNVMPIFGPRFFVGDDGPMMECLVDSMNVIGPRPVTDLDKERWPDEWAAFEASQPKAAKSAGKAEESAPEPAKAAKASEAQESPPEPAKGSEAPEHQAEAKGAPAASPAAPAGHRDENEGSPRDKRVTHEQPHEPHGRLFGGGGRKKGRRR